MWHLAIFGRSLIVPREVCLVGGYEFYRLRRDGLTRSHGAVFRGFGGGLGGHPAGKLSMMINRPAQHGHGNASMRGCSSAFSAAPLLA